MTDVVVTQTRTLLNAVDTAHATRIQNEMVRRAVLFRSEIEAELQRELLRGGFLAADIATAQTNAIAAVKAALW
jgi:hypothetical protein